MKPEITLVYDVDCPNVNAARTALGQAIARARLDPGWIECERTTPGLPQRFLRFGSPTILVNGKDVADEPGAAAACCRIYQAPDGLRGVPPVEAIVAAIERAAVPKNVGGTLMTKTTASGALGLAFVSALGWLCCLPIATRRKFLEAHAGSDVLVIPAHFPRPSVGHIVPHGATWRF